MNRGFCIDELFDLWTNKKDVLEVISKKCGFDEMNFVEIICERFVSSSLKEHCDMTKKTAINAANFVIADLPDEDIKGIDFYDNKKIEYLPYKIYKQLPSLIEYLAYSCSIKQISKENFEKLSSLEVIRLENNRIQKILGNTFKGLERLKKVDLSKFHNF